MGIRLRKSVRLGPFRINLSKSGMGYSAGVKGARVGKSATGRVYARGGTHGVYFDETLKRGEAQPSAEELIQQSKSLLAAPNPKAIEFFQWLMVRVVLIVGALLLLLVLASGLATHR